MKWMIKILLLVVAKDKDSCNNENELCAEDYKSQEIKSKIQDRTRQEQED